jgi:molecular chaperone DnaK
MNCYFGESFDHYIMDFYGDDPVRFSINKEEYDDIIKDFFIQSKKTNKRSEEEYKKNIVDPILNTLRDYNIDKNSIDCLFLTGGMTKYKVVRDKLKEILNLKDNQIINSTDPLSSIAKGAAIYAVGRKKIMEQRTRHNYCFRQADRNGIEHFTLCIPYAKALPAKSRPLPMTRIGNRLEVSIAYDETGKEISTGEGEEADPSRMREFRRFYFDEASGEVTFAVDENMMLTVTLKTEDGREISRCTGRLKGEKAHG